jgi:hypothetical protein
LRQQADALEAEVSAGRVKAREGSSLNTVAANAARILPLLDVERPEAAISLSTTDLTIKVHGVGRDDYLWELGSGSNWLSYHVATTLALQQFFLALRHSPVPSVLFYDQPSQVYFPTRVAGPASAENDPGFTDEDVQATAKTYSAVDSVVGGAKDRLQVIVLDHAGSAVWGNLPHVHLVEEWRGKGGKLIPEEWFG